MSNSIVVYTIKSENPDITNMYVNYSTAMHMIEMGLIRHCPEEREIICEGNTTVSVFVYRKA